MFNKIKAFFKKSVKTAQVLKPITVDTLTNSLFKELSKTKCGVLSKDYEITATSSLTRIDDLLSDCDMVIAHNASLLGLNDEYARYLKCVNNDSPFLQTEPPLEHIVAYVALNSQGTIVVKPSKFRVAYQYSKLPIDNPEYQLGLPSGCLIYRLRMTVSHSALLSRSNIMDSLGLSIAGEYTMAVVNSNGTVTHVNGKLSRLKTLTDALHGKTLTNEKDLILKLTNGGTYV